MPSRDYVKNASKLVWSGILFLLATILLLLAFAPLATSFFLRDSGEILIEVIVALLMFGVPGAWCAYAGIRSLLAAGRVPQDEGTAPVSNKPPKTKSMLITVGRNLFVWSLILGFLLLVLIYSASFYQYQPGAESNEETLGAITIAALSITAITFCAAGLGFFLMIAGVVVRLGDTFAAPKQRSNSVRPTGTWKTETVMLRAIGGIAILMAAWGLFYNLVSFSSIIANLVRDPEAPYLLPAFIIMSVICVGCYVVLGICGLQFVRLRPRVINLFIGVLLFEVIYFFAISAMWMVSAIGMSIGAATGIANGGMMMQFVILFPVWAPIFAYWSARRMAYNTPPTLAREAKAIEG